MKKYLLLIFISLLLNACTIYRADVQQGNIITRDMLTTVKIGMTQRDVVKILGNPLLTDPFHINRWDYYYYHENGSNHKVNQNIITLYFEEGLLQKIQGDVPPNLLKLDNKE